MSLRNKSISLRRRGETTQNALKMNDLELSGERVENKKLIELMKDTQ
jgi:hypothetical protein